jgi:3-oxo-5-alpha-steroid 4-dehydrogenase 1
MELFLTLSTYTMLLMSVVTYIACSSMTAPYGKFTTSKGWGICVPARIAWFIMESPNLWVTAIVYLYYATPECRANGNNNLLMTLFVLHYINRSVLYPLRMPRSSAPMPITVMLLAFSFCLWNGVQQSVALGVVQCANNNWGPLDSESDSSAYLSALRMYLGITLFVLGAIINIHSDQILMNLKTNTAKGRTASMMQRSYDNSNTNNKRYVIPRGGLFEYVSCANYFGEIVEWSGFALACGTLPALAFAVYTFSNLAPRAVKQHAWYKQKFEDYPKDRAAVIPFLL